MAIDPRYIASASLQEFFVNKDVDSPVDSGLPLSSGIVTFYRDASRTELKPVYTISGDYPNYTFTALPNPLVLSSVGTPQDDDGNDIIIYYFPFISESDNTPDLYYVTVYSSTDGITPEVLQFTRESWPPNAAEGSSSGSLVTWSENFIPNPQFLDHNNLPDDGLLLAGTNPVARGGWYSELPDPVSSTNFIRFIPLPNWTSDPAQSPPFELNWICTIPNGADNVKRFGVGFGDVNKFADNNQPYRFAFWAAANTTSTNVTVQIVKNFGDGGSTEVTRDLEDITITSDGRFFNIAIDSFGDNAGKIIGPGSYVALAISVDPNLAFNLLFTDFGLVIGDGIVTNFPIQTNADTIARSIFGWAALPDPNGFDLYLPPLLTKGGMVWDDTQIGEIISTIFPVNPVNVLTQNNLMPADGTVHLTSDYAANGIPLARLGQKLISNSSVPNIPMFGTGANYATAYAYTGLADTIRLTVNSPGTGSVAASDVSTGWTIGNIVNFDGSDAGANTLNYKVYSNVANTFLAVGAFPAALSAFDDGTSGFTLTQVGGVDNFDGLLAQQGASFTALCTTAAALANPGNPGKYFQFSNASVDYYIWYRITNETDPAPGGDGIRIDLVGTETAQDVANITREVMNAYQVSNIQVTGQPPVSSYWIFFTNPASPQRFFVWYAIDDEGTEPITEGTGIRVDILSDDTNAEIATKTLISINAYQYAAPDFRGMFLRGADPTGIWDFDNAQRWSSISGLSGAVLGTFEYSQFLSHAHLPPSSLAAEALGALSPGIVGGYIEVFLTGSTGGTETRPVNAYVNYAIRY